MKFKYWWLILIMVPTIYSTCFVVLSSVFKKKNPKKIQGAHFFNLFSVYFCIFVVFLIHWNLCLFSNLENAIMLGVNTGVQ